jgi:ubiquitin-activating enzyme E1
MYFDAFECLPDNFKELSVYPEKISRYDGQIAIFGKKFQKKLSKHTNFIVGAGAIGCELLKNYAMMGVGNIYVTDMDTIEKSNLNRQFLFRYKDINKPKSIVAAIAVKKMNPKINIIAHQNRVGKETENIYNYKFYQSINCVTNALDNIQARLYMDEQCVYYGKTLLESGTLGTKGNVQVIIPNITESYGSSQDPPEQDIPVCTIKNFPHNIVHTCEWAKEVFETLFCKSPNDAVSYIQYPNKINEIEPNQAIAVKNNIKLILNNIPTSFEDCITMAYNTWHEYYRDEITDLLKKFPPDSKTKSGAPFWSGEKRCPNIQFFDINNSIHINYIISFSKLWAGVYGIKANTNITFIKNVLQDLKLPDKKNKEEQNDNLTNPEEHKKLKIISTEFEKDDDSNGHIDFITACANMRALNYGIKPADKHQIKGISGKIIPALISTTGICAGLVSLELYKIIQGFKKIEKYHDTFLNLALPYMAFSEPKKAKVTEYKEHRFTLWDKFEIKQNITLQELLDYFKKEYDYELDFVSYGSLMLYSFFTEKETLILSIKDIIEKELEQPLTEDVIELLIGVEDDLIDLPSVMIKIR